MATAGQLLWGSASQHRHSRVDSGWAEPRPRAWVLTARLSGKESSQGGQLLFQNVLDCLPQDPSRRGSIPQMQGCWTAKIITGGL